jgi:hypothetical protein
LAAFLMRTLDLVSGSVSVGVIFASERWEVFRLYLDLHTEAIIYENIFTLGHTVFPPEHFDVVWASPCCAQYSNARRGAKTSRNLLLADSLVLRTLEQFEYFQPRFLVSREPPLLLLGLGYRKRAHMWTNISLKGILCECPGHRLDMQGKAHKTSVQQGGGGNKLAGGGDARDPTKRKDVLKHSP